MLQRGGGADVSNRFRSSATIARRAQTEAGGPWDRKFVTSLGGTCMGPPENLKIKMPISNFKIFKFFIRSSVFKKAWSRMRLLESCRAVPGVDGRTTFYRYWFEGGGPLCMPAAMSVACLRVVHAFTAHFHELNLALSWAGVSGSAECGPGLECGRAIPWSGQVGRW